MKQLYIYYLLVLKHYLNYLFEPYYPIEIIYLIIMSGYGRTRINCGCNHTNVTYKDTIYVFGRGDNGRLGLGSLDNQKSPTKLVLPGFKSRGFNITEISSTSHTVVLIHNPNPQMYVWGLNSRGQLGLGSLGAECVPQKLVFPFEDFNILKICCGGYYTTALTESNDVCVWGDNSHGQLGLGHTDHQTRPQKLNLHDIICVSCGPDHTIVLTKSKKAYSCGINDYGQLGLGHT